MCRQEFFSYIQTLDETFENCYKKCSHAVGISKWIVNELVCHAVPVVCSKFPKLLFLHYFVRVRIYYKLKFANAIDKKNSCSKNRKLMNLKNK